MILKFYNNGNTTLVFISISGLLESFTGYGLYTTFGKPAQQQRDPFKEH